MGMIETLAEAGINKALSTIVTFKGEDKFDETMKIWRLSAQAQLDLIDKLQDRKLDQSEIDDLTKKLASVCTAGQLESIKSSLDRIVSSIFR